jgi:hypothetical protein
MATVFQSACEASGDWDQTITDSGCTVGFGTPTAGRMRCTVDSSAADSAWVRKINNSLSATSFTLAIRGLNLVQHGGASGVSAAIILQLQDGFSTYIEIQIDSAKGLFCRNIAGSPIHSATINGDDYTLTENVPVDLLLQAQQNTFFRYYIGPTSGSKTLIQNSTSLSGGAAVTLERIAAGLISVPTTWSGTDMAVEFDDITWTDSPTDDPYEFLASSEELAISLPHAGQGIHAMTAGLSVGGVLPHVAEGEHDLDLDRIRTTFRGRGGVAVATGGRS